MTGGLVLSALLMGLAGAPHCVTMCGAACGGLLQPASVAPAEGDAAALVRPVRLMRARSAMGWTAPAAFHLGRIAGYAAAGAVVAAAFGVLASLVAQVEALRPLWVLMHGGVLGWGLMLAFAGRQPVWAASLGHAVGRQLQPWTATAPRLLVLGAAWVLMPCGLLYSALMLAALSAGPLEGAGVMALFAAASAPALWVAPRLWLWMRGRLDGVRRELGTRVGGVLLAAVAGQALWMDMRTQIARWCA